MPSASATLAQRNRTVLVVDDDEVRRYVTRRTLEQHQFNVVLAETGEEAITFAREQHPSAVLLDIKLPDTSGLNVCRRIRQLPDGSRMAVVLYSGCIFEPASEADAFLTYPVDEAELVMVLTSAIQRRSAQTATP